jgi:hypothetical protein
MSSSRGVPCVDAGGDQNFRFGPMLGASYSSLALDTTNLPREQAPRDLGHYFGMRLEGASWRSQKRDAPQAVSIVEKQNSCIR